MLESIIKSFESYIRNQNLFSDEEITTIRSVAKPVLLKKKQYVLHRGSVCRFHTFVCSGCLRSYRIDDNGIEHIFNLSPADHWVSDRISLATETPSIEFIDALEDTSIIQISANNFNRLVNDIPNFNTLNTKIIIDECNTNRDRIYMMLRHQAEGRYRQFVQCFPQLHHRIPLFMIASYLGVTRETLTRIRGSMMNFQ